MKRGCSFAASVKSLGADCIEKPLDERHKAELSKLLEAAGINGAVDPGSFRLYGSARNPLSFPHRQCRIVLMEPPDRWIDTPPRMSATFDEFALAEIRRAAATGIYDIRGFGAKRKLPHFDDLLVSRRFGQSLSARRLSRKMRDRRDDRRPVCK